MKAGIIMHAGARLSPVGIYQDTLKKCTIKGIEVLKQGGTCLDAVEKAIVTAEDSAVFNSGSGSHLNLSGQIEMDAAVMVGESLKSGAVGAIPKVKNPIKVARVIMEDTDHILMVGEGAYRLARAAGIDEEVISDEEKVAEWRTMLGELKETGNLSGINLPDPSKLKKWLIHEESTVGCVAIDQKGNIAVGISSGGTPMKLPGRVGDVPVLGASFFADNRVGGISITGTGRIMIQNATARWAIELIKQGIPLQIALEAIVKTLNKKYDAMVLGMIALDQEGNVSAARNLDGMPHCYQNLEMDKPSEGFAVTFK